MSEMAGDICGALTFRVLAAFYVFFLFQQPSQDLIQMGYRQAFFCLFLYLQDVQNLPKAVGYLRYIS